MTHATEGRQDVIDFVNNIQAKVNAQEGNSLPVSAFKDYVDGTTPSGAAAYEKRGIAVNVPVWNPENCIQCNRCSFVCPHAVIRPVAMTAEEAAAAPAAIGAFSENEKNFGKSLIFVALGEGVAIYGLLISILIINKI